MSAFPDTCLSASLTMTADTMLVVVISAASLGSWNTTSLPVQLYLRPATFAWDLFIPHWTHAPSGGRTTVTFPTNPSMPPSMYTLPAAYEWELEWSRASMLSRQPRTMSCSAKNPSGWSSPLPTGPGIRVHVQPLDAPGPVEPVIVDRAQLESFLHGTVKWAWGIKP